MRDRKGVATIVVTVILVALVLIAVGIVWAVISNLISRGASQIDVSGICVGVTVQPTALSCTGELCDVTVERSGTETRAIGGLKLVFKNDTANSAVFDSVENSLDCGDADGDGTYDGDIPSLVPTKCTSVNTTIYGTNRVEITVYVRDAQGTSRLCSQTTTYTV